MRFIRNLSLAIFIFALFAAPAFAIDAKATFLKIDQEAMRVGMSDGELALLKTYAMFAPEKLPQRLVVEQDKWDGQWTCGTPEILTIHALAKTASPAIRAEISQYMNLEEPRPVPRLATKAVTRTINPHPDSGFTTNSYQTEHFNFKWGENTSYTLDDIENWGVIFEEIWDIEVEGWNFPEVYLSDLYYLDVYLGNTGDSTDNRYGINFQGAYTTVYYDYQSSEGSGAPYFVFHPDILYADEYIKDVSSHEFFHSMQFTIIFNNYCYGYMDQQSNWGVEGTATWAEDQAYDDINLYRYHISPYAEAPHKKLDDSSSQQVYARVIWWKYLSERFGGLDAIWDLWNDDCKGTLWDSANAIMSAQGSSINEEFPKYAVANLMEDYEEGSSYPDFEVIQTINSYPASYEIHSTFRPQLYGTNYIELYPPADKSGSLFLRFEGDAKISNRPLEWWVQIIGYNSKSDYDVIQIQVENGYANTEVEGLGTDYNKMYLVVSPWCTTRTYTTTVNYTVDFDTQEIPDTDDDDDDDDDDQDDDDNSDDDDQTLDDDSSSDDDDDDDDDDGCGC